MRLKMNSRGQMVDKYGRVFEFSPEKHKKVRKTRAHSNVAVLSHEYKGQLA